MTRANAVTALLEDNASPCGEWAAEERIARAGGGLLRGDGTSHEPGRARCKRGSSSSLGGGKGRRDVGWGRGTWGRGRGDTGSRDVGTRGWDAGGMGI